VSSAVLNVELRGTHALLMVAEDPEILLEGPVGTGKTRSLCEKARMLAETYPGCRILFVRKTRVSLTESVLVTWETQVLGENHPAIVGTATRANRTNYVFPNTTEVVCGGIDNPDRILSTEYDFICCFEAAEFAMRDVQTLGTRLRNFVVPYQQLVMDTNPRGWYHWINQRALKGLCRRLKSRHWMNPAFYDTKTKTWYAKGRDYLGRVRRGLTGALFKQLFLGEWAQERGLVYPMYDPQQNDLDATVEAYWGERFLRFSDGSEKPIAWVAASVDWGYTVPGTIQVWAFTKDRTAYCIAEIYRSGEDQNWWADRIKELHAEFGIRRVVCDPAEPDRIKIFNDILGTPGGRDLPSIAVKANNAIRTGIAHTQALMASTAEEPSKIYFLKNRQRCRERALGEMGKPQCVTDELLHLYWEENDEDKPVRERPDPRHANHGADALRYMMLWAWRKDLEVPTELRPVREGSYAAILKHREQMEVVARAMLS